ncbi:MAG: helix-turn-helix transcriptional regulator [Bauldia sp.]|nr:helix-turn-helix transcriptional regulator [Bauldia sp.]
MNRPVRTKTPSGEEIVMLPAADYERLLELAEDAVDARIAERALAELRSGRGEALTHDDMLALLDAPSPVAFWRKRRELTQAALAKVAEISQAYLAQIESGKRVGEVGLYRRLADALRVDIEDLLPDVDTAKVRRKSGGTSGKRRVK